VDEGAEHDQGNEIAIELDAPDEEVR